MQSPFLSHVRTWIFDLDNTLYPAATNLFALIDDKMGQYISEKLAVDRVEARRIQKQYFHQYGMTLWGLMQHHDVDPHGFLDFVHDIDLGRVTPSTQVRTAISNLPGRALVFTNGDHVYAGRVLKKLGLDDLFVGIHDIHATDYRPKPMQHAYDSLCQTCDIDPETAVFVEDMARNLKPAKAMGMTTIWLNNGSEGGTREADRDYIDHEITDLGDWLSGLNLSSV